MPKDLTALRELLTRHPAPWVCVNECELMDANNEYIIDIWEASLYFGELTINLAEILVSLVNAAAEDVG